MTPRERVLAALSRREPDAIPVDLGSFHDSTLSIHTHQELAAHFGEPFERYHLYDWTLGMVYPDPALLERFHVDTRNVNSGPGPYRTLEEYYRAVGVATAPDGSRELRDERGVVASRKPAGAYGFQVPADFAYPLGGELSRAAVDAYFDSRPPVADDPRASWRVANARQLHAETDLCVVGNLMTVPVLALQELTGMEDFFLNLALQPAVVGYAVERLVDHRLPEIERYYRGLGPFVDVAYCVGDDLADQRSPLLGLTTYRELFKPAHRRVIETVRRCTNARIIFHMCGAAAAFLPDLIDLGVDAVNPVQTTAAGMAPERLKGEFGHDLAFWGAIDTQRILPFGTPEEVREEVRRKIDILGRGGGYVFAPCHNIQVGTPAANIAAMYEAAHEDARRR